MIVRPLDDVGGWEQRSRAQRLVVRQLFDAQQTRIENVANGTAGETLSERVLVEYGFLTTKATTVAVTVTARKRNECWLVLCIGELTAGRACGLLDPAKFVLRCLRRC